MSVPEFIGGGRLYDDHEVKYLFHICDPEAFINVECQGPGHELPADQPFKQVYVDPDNQEFFPKPPNERTIGISSEPDRDTGSEVEV